MIGQCKAVLALLAALALAGCDSSEPTVYKIPKEERNVAVPTTTPPAAKPVSNNGMQVLPGMAESSKAAPELSYEVPASWEEYPPQSVRKANFRVSDESGSADITVTVFPGDVGGTLANINRWRSQIQLAPIELAGVSEVTEPFQISKHNGMIATLNGPEQSIVGGILSFHGSTWFFKMQGAVGTVAAQNEAMRQFLASVELEDHNH
ncbi:MAG: hypothetical protein AAF065_03550 [Verrucomicrobiota bacterium]